MRLVALFAVAVPLLGAAPAMASPPPSQPNGFVNFPNLDQTPPLSGAITELYRLEGSRDTPKTALARLNRWCASERRADQQRCEAAWQRINAEYARMQAARADEEG